MTLARAARQLVGSALTFAALTISGAALAHLIGYGATHPAWLGGQAPLPGHGYLGALGPWLATAGAIAAARALVARGARLPRASTLAVAQLLVLGAAELIEHSGHGLSHAPAHALGEPAVAMALLAQPFVALASLHLLRRGRDVLSELADAPVTVGLRRATRPLALLPQWSLAVLGAPPVLALAPARGPPSTR